MIYCVWYPSGGFGHFVNAILTLHGDNFVRPKKSLDFSSTGDSHSLDLVVPKYLHECWPGGIEFLNNKNYCVLIDNGIDNQSSNFKITFPNATVFLYLRDHPLRYAWQPKSKIIMEDTELDVGELYEDYDLCRSSINGIVKTEDFYDLWKEWREANAKYVDPVKIADNIVSCILTNHHEDLTHISDIWTQAVVYYYIWVKYNIEVPHNDYSNWFTNTADIVKMLKEHGVDIDSN